MSHIWTALAVMLFAAAVSFFLAGMEAGVFALSPVRIRHWVRKGRPRAALLHGYMQRPEDFFWTILVGNTLANVVVIGLVVLFLHSGLGDQPWLALVIFLGAVFVLYLAFDLFPKMLFRAYPNRLCLSLVGVFRVLHVCLQPLVRPLRWFSKRVVGLGGDAPSVRQVASKEELRLALQESNPDLTGEERVMIGRVLDLGNVKVGQLATPLSRMVTVAASVPMSEVLRLCREHRLTRLPVWREDGGGRRIAGVVSLKALLYQQAVDPGRPAGDLLKPAVFLDENLGAEEALRRLQRSGQRLAIVLGPGRRETGLVSLQDILRFVFGEVTE